MVNKYKKNFKVLPLYIVFIFVMTFIYYFMIGLLQKDTFHAILFAILNSLLVIFIFFILSICIILVIHVLGNFAIHTVRMTKLSKIDFVESKELYRDILYDYSVSSLSYFDQMNYDPEIATIAGLLNLEKKGYIQVQNNRIEKLRTDSQQLNLPEKYIYNSINNNLVKFNANTLWETIIEDCQTTGIVEQVKRNAISSAIKEESIHKENKYSWKITIPLTLLIFTELVSEYYFGKIGKLFGPILFFIILVYYVSLSDFFSYKRTIKGKELNKKLEGLKAYIKQYSNLDDSTSKELVLWDDYLIYSVIFKQNKKIIKEYKQFLNLT